LCVVGAAITLSTAVRFRVAFLLLFGCSNGPSVPDQTDSCSGEPPPADGQPTVGLGREVGGPFQPLADGDALEIVHGPQGGQHVYVVVHLYVKSPGVWIHELRFADASGNTLGDATAPVQACGPGWTSSDHARVFLRSADPASGVLTITSHAKDAPDGTPPLTARAAISVH
jgi:hypothetical protein